KHDKHVRKTMKKLMEAGITLNIKKCKFNTTKVNYLGMVFLPEELKIPKEKLDSI
ncbi:hypothetical protein M432DRAFT_530119, partial [Thermoascus aurantiacus ATCC 26904]